MSEQFETDLMGALNEAAEDWESDVLESLAVRCGYWWRCSCGWINRYDEPTCGHCAAARPVEEDS